MMKNLVIILLISLSFTLEGYCQIITENTVRKELSNQGIDQNELEKRLRERGFDLDNIDPQNLEEVQRLQQASEEIIAEMRSESNANNAIPTSITEVPEVKDTFIPSNEVIAEVEKEIGEANNKGTQVYGQDLFSRGGIRFYAKSEYVNTPEDYVLGPGDMVTVAIFGKRVQENFSQAISKTGFVKFDRIQRIYLGGLKLSDAREQVKTILSRSYPFTDNEFEFSVNATRNINIYITGEAVNVGSVNISAVNTAINALAAGGGPTEIGSLRNIQIIGADKKKRNLDLYEFLLDPVSTRDLYLNEGDYIAVPLLGKVVNIIGAVNRPMYYELKEEETLQELIDFAGGLKVNALRKNIKITRYKNDERIVLNVNILDENSWKNIQLEKGDVIEINTIDDELSNAVIIEGAVENGGEFAIESGTRISDIMNRIVLEEDAILDVAFFTRLNDDKKTVRWNILNLNEIQSNLLSQENIILQNGDRIIIRRKSAFVQSNSFEVRGAVNSPSIYPLNDDNSIRVSDAIFLSNGLTPRATNFAYLIRNNPTSISPEYIEIDISNILKSTNGNSNIFLQPGDVLNVYRVDDYIDDSYVTIDGAVRNPQSYPFDESLELSDVLRLSKGLTFEADRSKIDIYRLDFSGERKSRTLYTSVSIDENLNPISGNVDLQPFDQIVVRKVPEFELQQSVFISGEVKYPGKYYLLKDNYTLVDLIEEAGGLTQEAFISGTTLVRKKNGIGFIVINLEEALEKPNGNQNPILQLNDEINIPKIENLVTVVGAVNASDAFNDNIAEGNKINFIYEGKNAKHYIDMAGGFADNAEKSNVSVKYPNGEVKRTKRFLFWKFYPKVKEGSIVRVGVKSAEALDNNEKEEIDWGNVLSNSIAQATTILSLILLIQNVD